VRLAIDARPALDPRRTGVGHYARQIVRHLPAEAPADEVVAWYLDPKGLLSRRRFFDDVGARNLTEHADRFPTRVFQPVSWRLRVPRLEWLVRFDALLATNFLPPPTSSRAAVLVVHDLAHEMMPDTAPHHDARWRRRFDRWLRRAAAVIVPSESTKRDLLARHDVAGEVHVIPHGAEPFAPPPAADVSAVRASFVIGGPYALFVGGIEPRKNLSALVQAFASLGDADMWLVIAGGRTNWIPHAAEALRAEVAGLPPAVRRRVVLPGYVGGVVKDALIAGATAIAYPSRYEGFGFPVLEGFAAGVPVLTSSTSSLPEVAGDAAVLVEPGDAAAIADGLRALFDDAELRERLIAAGRDRVRGFTWERSAARTAEVLRAAAHR
jgi:glycosyltransferase involved in cell wall biosynthesis